MDTPGEVGNVHSHRKDGFMGGIRIGKSLSCKLWDIDGTRKAGQGARATLFSGEWEMFVTAEQKVLQAVAMQLMNGDEVALDEDGQKLRVKRVGSGRLRMVQFKLNGRMFEAIEQNREKPSRWGKLAREKHQVVQFRDVATHKYMAVAVDGEITEYGR
jgi:hypothetical protein